MTHLHVSSAFPCRDFRSGKDSYRLAISNSSASSPAQSTSYVVKVGDSLTAIAKKSNANFQTLFSRGESEMLKAKHFAASIRPAPALSFPGLAVPLLLIAPLLGYSIRCIVDSLQADMDLEAARRRAEWDTWQILHRPKTKRWQKILDEDRDGMEPEVPFSVTKRWQKIFDEDREGLEPDVASAEERSTEELPTKDLSTEEHSTAELITAEHPTSELSTAELSTAELSSGELFTEERSTDELFTDELSTKEPSTLNDRTGSDMWRPNVNVMEKAQENFKIETDEEIALRHKQDYEDIRKAYAELESTYMKFLVDSGMSKSGYWRGSGVPTSAHLEESES